MEAIIKAENQGYILEDDLINEIGSEQVDSLVDYNFLHCRPTSNFANDPTTSRRPMNKQIYGSGINPIRAATSTTPQPIASGSSRLTFVPRRNRDTTVPVTDNNRVMTSDRL